MLTKAFIPSNVQDWEGGKYVATDVKYGAGIVRGGEEDDLQR